MTDCKDPYCVYSINKKKCVKPNPYIQFLSYCKREDKSLDVCKNEYKINKDIIKKNACKFYYENKTLNKNTSCPKYRRPNNDICPDEYKILKKNKYNIDCCYKEKKLKKYTSSFENISKDKSSKSLSSKSLSSKSLSSKSLLSKKLSSKDKSSKDKSSKDKSSKDKSSKDTTLNKLESDIFKDYKKKDNILFNKKLNKLAKKVYKYKNKEKKLKKYTSSF